MRCVVGNVGTGNRSGLTTSLFIALDGEMDNYCAWERAY